MDCGGRGVVMESSAGGAACHARSDSTQGAGRGVVDGCADARFSDCGSGSEV